MMQPMARTPQDAAPLVVVQGRQGRGSFVDEWNVLVRSGAGAEALLELAFDRCYAMVYTVAHRITGSPWDAEDLAQGVFETFARKLDTVREPAAIPGFLKTTAVRAAMRHCKRGRWMRRRRLVLQAEHAMDPGRQDRGGSAISAAAVRQVLERLTPEERTVVILKLVEGHSHEEVAALMNVSKSTARRRLDSARERINAMAGDPVSTAVLAQMEDAS
jgi:RNA polymerase sigma-70 factor (ECF subfamily)